MSNIFGTHRNPDTTALTKTVWYGKDVNAALYYIDNSGKIQAVDPTHPLPVTLASAIVVDVDIDGVYNVATNPDPDNIGLISHERHPTPGDAQQIMRTTAANPTADGLDGDIIVALDANDFSHYYNLSDGWERQKGADGNAFVAIRDESSQLDLVVIDSAYGNTPVVMPIAGKYESVPTSYANGDATPFLVNEYGELRIAGYNPTDDVVDTNVNNQHSTSDTGVITFLNGVTASTTSSAYNSFQYSQWHILTKVVTDATGAGDIYLDASVDNSDWDNGILSQNIAAGSATTYYYTWTIDGCYNYIRIRFVKSADTITVTTKGIGRGMK